jgi:hypothetical protein
MRDADNADKAAPSQPAPQSGGTTPAPDPEDFGTAYGMELSIGPNAKQAPAEDDVDDPLGWIRRWVDQHKPAT